MAEEQENKEQEIYESELEEGSVDLAERLCDGKSFSRDLQIILPALCSIAISLKKIAEEANMRFDK